MAKQMQYAICRPAAHSLHRAAHTLEQHGLHWLKFGNEYFCHSGDAATPVDWSKVEAADAGLTPLTRRSGPSDTRSLYLVFQEGRLFQRAYPDVPVLFDKGRHLVVSLDPRDVSKIAKHEARFSMRPAKKMRSSLRHWRARQQHRVSMNGSRVSWTPLAETVLRRHWLSWHLIQHATR